MIVRSIHLHNFMPYYADVMIDFPEDEATNTTIFYGENTKGKTSILNAFRWVLYGEAESKGRTLGYRELLNRKAESEGESEIYVELIFTSFGDHYVVRRTMTGAQPGGKGSLRMQKNGQPVTHDEAVQTIERIAPYGTRRFFLFDGELLREYEELMEPTSNTAKKIKKAIEDVMGFPTLMKTLEILDAVEKKFRKESAAEKTSNEAVKQLKEERDNLDSSLNEKVAELERLGHLETETRSKLSELAEAIDGSKQIKEKYDDLQRLKNERDFFKEQIDDNEGNLREAKRDVWKSLLYENISAGAERAMSDRRTRNKLEAAVEKLNLEISDLQRSKETEVCATCNQDIRDLSNLTERIQAKLEQVATIRREIESMPGSDALIEISMRLSNAPRLQDYLTLEKSADQAQARYNDNIDKIRRLQDEIGAFDGAGVDAKLITKVKLQQSLEQLAASITALEGETAAIKSKKLSLSKRIEELSRSDGVSKEHALLETQQLSDIFEKAKGFLRGDIKVHVEKAAMHAFLEMTSRPDDYAGLKITDSYGLEMIARDGSVVPQRSAGAEQVVALALIDGLNRVGRSPGPVIMDTPFGRLDQTHRANILAYMPKSARQFMVFVHSGELQKDSAVLDPIKHLIGKQYSIKSSGSYVSYLEEV